jgi:hypothetical protein
MCRSAKADLSNIHEQSVLRYTDPGTAGVGYCLAERQMLLLKGKKLVNKVVRIFLLQSLVRL